MKQRVQKFQKEQLQQQKIDPAKLALERKKEEELKKNLVNLSPYSGRRLLNQDIRGNSQLNHLLGAQDVQGARENRSQWPKTP